MENRNIANMYRNITGSTVMSFAWRKDKYRDHGFLFNVGDALSSLPESSIACFQLPVFPLLHNEVVWRSTPHFLRKVGHLRGKVLYIDYCSATLLSVLTSILGGEGPVTRTLGPEIS